MSKAGSILIDSRHFHTIPMLLLSLRACFASTQCGDFVGLYAMIARDFVFGKYIAEIIFNSAAIAAADQFYHC